MSNCSWKSALKILRLASERLNGTARRILAVVQRAEVCNKVTFHKFWHWEKKKLKAKFFLQLLM